MGSDLKRWSRFMVYRLCLLLLMGCAGPATHSAVRSAATLDEIVTRNSAAVGSATVKAQRMQIDLTMHDTGQEFDAVYSVTRDGRMRIDILKGGKRVYTEAYDGKQGWDMEGDGSVSVDPHGDTLWHGTQFPGQLYTLADMAHNGHKLEYQGREQLDGVDYYVLKLTLSDGFETYRYVNPDTWLIDRGRDYRAFHPAMDAKQTWVETVWSDYRPVDGLRRSWASENRDLNAGKALATQQVTAIRLDPPIPDSYFEMPTSK